MNSRTITIIGGGNMGTSLIGGLLSHHHDPNQIIVTDPDSTKLEKLKEKFGVKVSLNNQEAIKEADVIIIAVKPQIFAQVASEIKESIQTNQPLVISIAAGIPIHKMQTWLGEEVKVIRTMPNTAALVGCSATALYASENINKEERELAQQIMEVFGIVIWMKNEADLDIVTALSGSGPAYFFLIMEALENAATDLGMNEKVARLLTLQTALGAACLAIESEEEPKTLRKNVTSKGGTTEAAIEVLEQEDIREVFRKALQAAKIRSEELAK